MVAAVSLFVLSILPLIVSPKEQPFLFSTVVFSFFYAYLASAWNILGGYTGLFNFGQASFVGLGAYSTILLYLWYGISPWLGMWVGVGLSVASSLVISLPSLRVTGHYFILITWVFEEALRYTATNWVSVTGGGKGAQYVPLDFSFVDFQFNSNRTPFYYIIFGMLLLCLVITYKLQSTKMGYYMRAIRDEPVVAEAAGIDVLRYKVLATALSAALTSIAGTFYVQYTLYIDPQQVLSVDITTRILMTAVFGGMGTLLGPTVGSFILTPLTEYIRFFVGGLIPGLHLVVYATILGATAVIIPEGLFGALSKRGILRSLVGVRVYTPPERVTY